MPLEIRGTLNSLQGNFQESIYKAALLADEQNNFIQFPVFPTDYILAQVANAAYQDDGGRRKDKIPQGWNCVALASNSEDGYFGAVYVSSNYQQVIIAHRGTEVTSIKDIHADIEGIVNNKVTSQMASADELRHIVMQSLSSVQQLSITGHSLGGWLAQVGGYHSEEVGRHVHVVVFDSPGAKNMLTEIQPKLSKNIELKHLDITNYVSAPNRINVCNEPLGTYKRVYVELQPASISEWLSHDKLTHSMDKIAEVFDANTGQPKQTKHVLDWPSIIWPHQQTSTYRLLAITSIIKDYFVDAQKDEYEQFFKWANKLNQYDPNPEELSYKEGYFLKHRAHYRVLSIQEHQSALSLFNQHERDFLISYQLLRDYANSETEHLFDNTHFPKAAQKLAGYRAITESGTVTIDNQTLQYIKQMLLLAPELSNQVDIQLKTLYPRIQQKIQTLDREQKDMQNQLDEQKKRIEERPSAGRTFAQRTAITNVPGSNAIRALDGNDYGVERTQEMLAIMEKTKPGDTYYQDSAVANAQGSNAIVISSNTSATQAALLRQLQYQPLSNTSSVPAQERRELDESINKKQKTTLESHIIKK